MSQPLNRTRSPSWLHALLGLALLSAQLLGQLHRVEHGGLPLVAHGHLHATERADAHTSSPGGRSAHSAGGPFGHAAGQTEQCRLYDQLAVVDVLLATDAVEPPAVDLASPPALVAVAAPRPAAAAGYLARAPPESA